MKTERGKERKGVKHRMGRPGCSSREAKRIGKWIKDEKTGGKEGGGAP